MSCLTFNPDSKGFTASIDQEKPNLVFFSVPYHEGWKAYVNGEQADIEMVNFGFMAVECGAGHSDIRFEFETPMLRLGSYCTLCCCLAFGVYVLFFAYDTGRNGKLSRFIRKIRSFGSRS